MKAIISGIWKSRVRGIPRVELDYRSWMDVRSAKRSSDTMRTISQSRYSNISNIVQVGVHII